MGYNNKRGGATYIWRVSWYDRSPNKKYKAFTNKQQALIFMTKLKSNRDNCAISLEKWNGDR